MRENCCIIVGDDSSEGWLVLSDESLGDDDGESQPGSKCPRVSLILMDCRSAKLTATKLPADFPSLTHCDISLSDWWLVWSEDKLIRLACTALSWGPRAGSSVRTDYYSPGGISSSSLSTQKCREKHWRVTKPGPAEISQLAATVSGWWWCGDWWWCCNGVVMVWWCTMFFTVDLLLTAYAPRWKWYFWQYKVLISSRGLIRTLKKF